MGKNLMTMEVFLAGVGICVFVAVALQVVARIRRTVQQRIVDTIPGVAVPMCEYRYGALVCIYIEGEQFDDRSATTLSKFRTLEEVQLEYTGISDDGIAVLKQLPRLRILWFSDAKVGDRGVMHLSDLTTLEFLSLRLETVSGETLQRLGKLRRLKRLVLDIVQVDTTAIEKLQRALPNCHIHRDELEDAQPLSNQ